MPTQNFPADAAPSINPARKKGKCLRKGKKCQYKN